MRSPVGRARLASAGATPLAALLLAALLLAAHAGIARSQSAAPLEIRLTVTRFVVEGPSPLSATETDELLARYTGEHAGLAGLEAAADALEQAIRARGLSFHRVTLPPQTPRDGVVRLQVLTFKLGSVTVTGNQYFSRENVLTSLPGLRIGETPDTASLGRSLAIVNEHPAKRAQLVMREGKETDTVDAEVRVQDNEPSQFFAALNNTGTSETGDYRISIGYQHANLFDRDHTLTLAYTTSPDHIEDVSQYGVYYSVPFYGIGGVLAAFAARSDVNSGTVADFFQVSGRGEFYGVRYTQAFLKRGSYGHKLTVSLDSKLFENSVSFLGTPVGTDIGSRPLALRYAGSALEAWGAWGWFAEYVINLDGGPRNSELDYALSRAGADQSWAALRYGADLSCRAGSWTAVARLRGQASDDALIAGEQFGLGGAASVRGFRERATSGDSAQQASIELWSPPLAEGLNALLFVDYGRRRYEVPVAGQPDADTIASVGAGLRWHWRRHLELALDAARVTDGLAGGTSAGASRVHFNAIFRF